MFDSTAELMLQHSIESVADVLTITSPANMARVQRIGRISAALGAMCGVSRPDHLARLAFASQLGTLVLPEDIVLKMHRGQLLTRDERRMVRALPDLGGQILARIAGLEADREIVRLHDVHAVCDGPLPLESAILRVAIAYDRLEAGGKSRDASIETLRNRHPMYESGVLDALEHYGTETADQKLERVVQVDDLEPSMVLVRDVIGSDGRLLLGEGQELSAAAITKLQTLAQQKIIRPMILVAVPNESGSYAER